MIITITLNAALDRTLRIEHPLVVGKLNRAVSSYLEPGGKGINVSRTIKALGGNSVALGFCGGTNGRIVKDMLTSGDIHHDFVDISGQMRVNTQIIDAQGGRQSVQTERVLLQPSVSPLSPFKSAGLDLLCRERLPFCRYW